MCILVWEPVYWLQVRAVEVIPISRLLLAIIRKPCMCMHACKSGLEQVRAVEV